MYSPKNEKIRWNGRQIRNACQTALALAEFDAQGGSHERVVDAHAEVKLKVDHLETVSNAYLQFIMYLKDIYGVYGERRAKNIGIRAREVEGKKKYEHEENAEEKKAGAATGPVPAVATLQPEQQHAPGHQAMYPYPPPPPNVPGGGFPPWGAGYPYPPPPPGYPHAGWQPPPGPGAGPYGSA